MVVGSVELVELVGGKRVHLIVALHWFSIPRLS